MKSVGIVRKVDNLGRIVIPKELRRTMGIDEGDPLEIFTEGDSIILKQYQRGCTFCGEADLDKMQEFKGKQVCEDCLKELGSVK